MEAAMRKSLVTITAALALVSGALLISGRAEAGGSASAPSKYTNANFAANQARNNQHAQKSNFAITEYSSSSAKNPQKH
jgi:hypothetical protein